MSEPSGKIGILGSVLSGAQRRNEENDGETVEFYLSLCFDVLLEVLRVGDRRRLIKLERVGRRFHWIIEKWFLDVPFLYLNFNLRPLAMSRKEMGMKAFIDADNEIALSKLVDVPRFLRFDQVALEYRIGSQHILQKCDSFHGYLSSIKATLTDSNVMRFVCQINQEDQSQFRNHDTLIEHIRSIVSICDSSRGYSFVFRPFTFDDHIASIASYLGMPAISRSSFVSFSFTYSSVYTLKQLPVEAISNWLNRERNAMDQNQRERKLELWLNHCLQFQQHALTQEICGFLKQKFLNDKLPAIPFTLTVYRLSIGEVEDQTVLNAATNEQFSVLKRGNLVEVKRTRALKKKEETSKTAKA